MAFVTLGLLDNPRAIIFVLLQATLLIQQSVVWVLLKFVDSLWHAYLFSVIGLFYT